MPGAGACHSRTVMGRPASLTSGQGDCWMAVHAGVAQKQASACEQRGHPAEDPSGIAADSNLAREARPARCLESCLITLGP